MEIPRQSSNPREEVGPRHCPTVDASRALGGIVVSDANSAFETVNREKPQATQTKSFGNSMTPELSKFLIPSGWTIISAENSIWLSELHLGQDITPPLSPPVLIGQNCTPLSAGNALQSPDAVTSHVKHYFTCPVELVTLFGHPNREFTAHGICHLRPKCECGFWAASAKAVCSSREAE